MSKDRVISALIAFAILTPSGAWAVDVKAPTYKARAATPRPEHRVNVVRSLLDVAEVEPNDGPAEAQAVGCGNALNPAALTNVSALPDSDWISFTATAGELITFETAPQHVLDPPTDTVINLFADDGTTNLASDDDSGTESLFSRIAEFEAPYTGLYYGRIRGFSGTEGPYQAIVTCVAPPAAPANDQCSGAPLITSGPINLSGTTRFATNDYDLCPGMPVCPASCTGFNSPGKDVVYKLEIAGAGELLSVTYSVSPEVVDASLYLVTDCSDVQGSCVGGQDSDIGTPDELLTHVFGAPGTYYLILDGFTEDGGDWTLQGCLNCATAAGKMSWGKLKTVYRSP